MGRFHRLFATIQLDLTIHDRFGHPVRPREWFLVPLHVIYEAVQRIRDQFEREANNFARFVLFQGNAFARMASDCTFGIRAPIDLSKKFGASIYASAREYARTNTRPCLVYVLEPIQFVVDGGARAAVRRIEASPLFKETFGLPQEIEITRDHLLWPVLPIGRKMSRPQPIRIRDRNGIQHECMAEAFDTTYNILILLYPVKALTSKSVVMP